MNASSSTSSTSVRCHGVFCFGSSLTAGTCGTKKFPYALALQQALQSSPQPGIQKTVVRHCGLPGWTAQRLRHEVDHPKRGLRTVMRRLWDTPSIATTVSEATRPSLDMVILLVGSNDLGLRRSEPAEDIAQDIIALHQICFDENVPRTIMVEIPPSGYQMRSPEARQLATSINENLEEWTKSDPRVTFVKFPYPYDKESGNWYRDGLHFSEQGYRVLGESLAPIVEAILSTIP